MFLQTNAMDEKKANHSVRGSCLLLLQFFFGSNFGFLTWQNECSKIGFLTNGKTINGCFLKIANLLGTSLHHFDLTAQYVNFFFWRVVPK